MNLAVLYVVIIQPILDNRSVDWRGCALVKLDLRRNDWSANSFGSLLCLPFHRLFLVIVDIVDYSRVVSAWSFGVLAILASDLIVNDWAENSYLRRSCLTSHRFQPPSITVVPISWSLFIHFTDAYRIFRSQWTFASALVVQNNVLQTYKRRGIKWMEVLTQSCLLNLESATFSSTSSRALPSISIRVVALSRVGLAMEDPISK